MAAPIDSAHLASRLGPRHPMAAAAVITGGSPQIATVGLDHPDAEFEIASITKGLTGLLYADAIERGEITPETRLGDLLPLDNTPAGEVTLGSITVHRSGLPGLPPAAHPYRRTLALLRKGTNPYGDTLDELLEQARTVKLGKPKPRYSNLGFELLGHALAAAASTSFADLLAARITDPLGMHHTYVPATPSELRPRALAGRSRRGRKVEAWTGEALGPAGGVRSTIGDMAVLAGALLDRSAPGMAALDPVATMARGARIGAAWITVDFRGHEICWHNGRTGGFASWIGIDRNDRTAAVVLTATSRAVDRHAFALLADAEPASDA